MFGLQLQIKTEDLCFFFVLNVNSLISIKMETQFFDIESLQKNFEAALKDEIDVAMDFYLEGFKELEKYTDSIQSSSHSDPLIHDIFGIFRFFQLMGSVFGFVSSDVKSKIEILEAHRKKDNAEQFETFAKMLEFETSSDLLQKNDYVSGSRTLLRLHRGLGKKCIFSFVSCVTNNNFLLCVILAFIREFLLKLSEIESHEKTSGICKVAYNETLAQYHPWIVRKGASIAMYALPTREQLLNKVCQDVERSISILPDVLEISKMVYDRTEQLYTDFGLHTLP